MAPLGRIGDGRGAAGRRGARGGLVGAHEAVAGVQRTAPQLRRLLLLACSGGGHPPTAGAAEGRHEAKRRGAVDGAVRAASHHV